ncbi:hypothetical protein ACDQ55_15170 [Chitinophaga sp. 30R24]|uniref:hypothetical protein n=1 Tax=Chitinophaga sp. 30R24 TaxID=3248838 RepID=UPI003B8EF09C
MHDTAALEKALQISFLNPTDKSILMVAAKDIGKLAADLLKEEWINQESSRETSKKWIMPIRNWA